MPEDTGDTQTNSQNIWLHVVDEHSWSAMGKIILMKFECTLYNTSAAIAWWRVGGVSSSLSLLLSSLLSSLSLDFAACFAASFLEIFTSDFLTGFDLPAFAPFSILGAFAAFSGFFVAFPMMALVFDWLGLCITLIRKKRVRANRTTVDHTTVMYKRFAEPRLVCFARGLERNM